MKRTRIPKLLLGVLFCLAFPKATFAEERITSLGLTPITQEISLEPGEQSSGVLRIVNPLSSSTTLKYQISIRPYSVTDELYNSDFDIESDFTRITNWITLEKTSGELEPGESDEIIFHVDTPELAPAGGQYAAFIAHIVEEEGPQSTSRTNITTSANVASLLFASVSGETYAEGLVLKNNIPNFIFNEPIFAESAVKNAGNVHLPATYTLQVFPLFSDEEIYTNEEKPKVVKIIPGTEFITKNSWQEAPLLGVYRVRQTITIGSENSVNEKIIFACPGWFFAAVFVFFLLCIYWIIYRTYVRRKLAKYANNISRFQAN